MENTPRTVRCAIYCRKSAAEKLDREGNSLDVQRNACLDFISAHRSEGWVALHARTRISDSLAAT